MAGWTVVPNPSSDTSAWKPVNTAAPSPETPSLLRTMTNNFNANTQGAQPGDSGLKGFVENIGQGGGQAIRGLANMIQHPLDSAHSEVDAVRAGPSVWLNQAHQEVDAARSDPSRAIGNAIGQLGTGEILGGAGVSALRPIVGKAGDMVANIRPKSSPAIVPPLQTAAENLAGSVVPKANDIPGFVDSVTRNAGNISKFADSSNNPLRTQAEFEKAVKGAGDERYQHFMKNILEPNAGTPVPVPEGYGGTRSGASTANLGDINNRIGRLNKLLSPAYGFANPGDVATALAKTPMEDLQAEHGSLVPLLHNSLSESTGIPPEQIGALRESFGSLNSLGDLITEARAGRTGKVGLANESTGGSSIPRPSLIPFVDQAWDAVRGGRNAIADRSFQKAWGNLKPLIGDAEPLPQSPEGFQSEREMQTAKNQLAAQREAARAHQLETSAQDAAAQRSTVADALRRLNTGKQVDAANQEFLHSNDLEQAAQDAAAQRAQRVADFKNSRDTLKSAQAKLQGEAARTVGRNIALKGGKQ